MIVWVSSPSPQYKNLYSSEYGFYCTNNHLRNCLPAAYTKPTVNYGGNCMNFPTIRGIQQGSSVQRGLYRSHRQCRTPKPPDCKRHDQNMYIHRGTGSGDRRGTDGFSGQLPFWSSRHPAGIQSGAGGRAGWQNWDVNGFAGIWRAGFWVTVALRYGRRKGGGRPLTVRSAGDFIPKRFKDGQVSHRGGWGLEGLRILRLKTDALVDQQYRDYYVRYRDYILKMLFSPLW